MKDKFIKIYENILNEKNITNKSIIDEIQKFIKIKLKKNFRVRFDTLNKSNNELIMKMIVNNGYPVDLIGVFKINNEFSRKYKLDLYIYLDNIKNENFLASDKYIFEDIKDLERNNNIVELINTCFNIAIFIKIGIESFQFINSNKKYTLDYFKRINIDSAVNVLNFIRRINKI